jgi:hypothetical protein
MNGNWLKVGEGLTKTPFIIAGVALIPFSITFAALWVFVIQPFDATNINFPTNPPTTSTPQSTVNPSLSPARNLVGTWETSLPVKFYIKTDFVSGILEDVGSQNRSMTWIITSTDNENVVNVEAQFSTSNTQLVDGSGYTPDASPMFLQGTISGLTLTLYASDTSADRVVGTFEFTSDIINGTWDDQWSLAYEQEVYTSVNGLTLSRQ